MIMPFGATKQSRNKLYWTNFFADFLRPSLNVCGYGARRSEGGPDNIVRGILEDLAWTNVMVAVLTDFNANVWYELGIRHSFMRGATVMICQQDQINRLPFDLRDHGVVSYPKDLVMDAFVQKLNDHLNQLGPALKDSPVSEFAHSGTAYCIHRAFAAKRSLLKLLEGCEMNRAVDIVTRLNEEWRRESLQITVLKDDKIIIHRGEVPIGTEAAQCWKDAAAGGASRYPEMKMAGEGLWLGAIEKIPGRLTACAYESVRKWEWLLVVEAHISQAEL